MQLNITIDYKPTDPDATVEYGGSEIDDVLDEDKQFQALLNEISWVFAELVRGNVND